MGWNSELSFNPGLPPCRLCDLVEITQVSISQDLFRKSQQHQLVC